ncbi:MAG: GNAT family N-acetyltransferase [Deltaproteobacteria bacterium]|nr:GNAT family N-acetyltransferase [Deltaproteobacteria bacterium]
MTRTIEIRPLVPADDRSGFSCGEPPLDRFFQHYAGQNQFKLRLSVTYVAVEDAEIVGFATVAVGSIEKQALPSKNLRQRLPAYPLPILRLARLGVAQSSQGSGVGYRLLRHVLELALAQRDTLGCVGVVTDAKPDAAAFYDKLGFMALEGIRRGRLHGGPTPMFLDIRTLAKALEG